VLERVGAGWVANGRAPPKGKKILQKGVVQGVGAEIELKGGGEGGDFPGLRNAKGKRSKTWPTSDTGETGEHGPTIGTD